MASIRTTKIGYGSTAVQVVKYEKRKVVVMKHIGSSHDPEGVAGLIESAEQWLRGETGQVSLFPKKKSHATIRYLGVTHAFTYTILSAIAEHCGFTKLGDQLLLDLAIIRMVDPASKRQSIKLLEKLFGIRYARRSVYRALPKFKERKKEVESIAVAFAKEKLSSDLALVLYDVTTPYFESFEADDLRKPGFSKDNKSHQPQIVVGLLVSREGFPLGFEVFCGNTFEGKTMIPVLENFSAAHGVSHPIIVADAAMLSRGNIAELQCRGLSYIVGARLANAKGGLVIQASTAIQHKEHETIRIPTDHGDLICAFSEKRFRKGVYELEKQIAKAKKLIALGQPGKRAKFVKRSQGKDTYVLNDALMEKSKLLLGIRGYYTNILRQRLNDEDIISRYHDPWHVEQAFRMAKSDLETRPIFHRRQDSIRAHIMICFIALSMGKYLELQTGLPLRRIMDILQSVTDAQIIDTSTGEEFTLRSELSEEVLLLLEKLRLSY